ncbi:MAG: hypothetical protein MJZ63_05430, partial [Muribaculaceae bacterium]|nr:hypothetical protein [Muribaculaceae bacterium]
NKVRLTESQLNRVIKECVNNVLNENQGFMDGVKGAWNGFKGSKFSGGFAGAVNGAVKGYKQGQQGQQQVLNNRRTQGIDRNLGAIMNVAQRAMQSYTSGNINDVEECVEMIQSYAEWILNSLNAQANQGVDYSLDNDFQN